MLKLVQLLALILKAAFAASSYSSHPRAGCSIFIPNLNPEPIVATVDTYDFIYADPAVDNILLNVDQTIIISCPGGILTVGSREFVTVEATCVSETNFLIEGEVADFNLITCSREPFHTARYTGASCESTGREIEIGFILTDTSFVREITICFDDITQNSLYSSYKLTRSIGHHESGIDRPSFIEDDFYHVDTTVNELYLRGNQRATINGLLGLPANSTKYIEDDTDFYYARGHLTAKADFVYAPQQSATFHYVNVAPQWQTFNGANWMVAEADVRDHAEANGLDLVVYTGTYGVSTLPHEVTGEEIELFFYVDGHGNTGLPVPEIYWKIAYNPATKEGIALVGINNPYQTDVSKSIICEDIQSQITWLNWIPDDLVMGYSYACTVDDFRAVVPYLSDLDVQGILY